MHDEKAPPAARVAAANALLDRGYGKPQLCLGPLFSLVLPMPDKVHLRREIKASRLPGGDPLQRSAAVIGMVGATERTMSS